MFVNTKVSSDTFSVAMKKIAIFYFLLFNFGYCRRNSRLNYYTYGSDYIHDYNYGFRSQTTQKPLPPPPHSPPPQSITNTCPAGWILYPGPFPLCIFRSHKFMSHDTANAKCKAMKAILAEPRTKTEIRFITGGLTNTNYYFGIKVASNCKATYASRGLPVPSTLWHTGYPVHCPKYPCVRTDREDTFVNTNCNHKNRFVCQMPLGGKAG